MRKVIAILLLLLAMPASVFATDWFVAMAYGAEANDGLSWSTAKSNLYSTITNASLGDRVFVGAGVYTGSTASAATLYGWSCRYPIKDGVSVIGTNRQTVILDGSGSPARRLVIASTNAMVSNLTIRAGSNGGTSYSANYFWGASLRNCDVLSCTSALYSVSGNASTTALVVNCVFSNNYGENGCVGYGTVSNSLFVRNWGGSISGVRFCRTYNSEFLYNRIGFYGVAGYGTNVACKFLYSYAETNEVGSSSRAPLVLGYSYSCLVAYNTNKTTSGGGGAYAEWYENCTVVWNWFAGASGCALTYSGAFMNTIVFGNVSTNANPNTFDRNNFYNGVPPQTKVFWTNVVEFVDEWKLPQGSGAIDSGNGLYAVYWDLYGRARVYGTSVDYGASEWTPADVPSSGSEGQKKKAMYLWRMQ